MKTIAAISALVATAAAWPTVTEQNLLLRRAAAGNIPNTGVGHPNPSWDAKDQYVDVTDGGPNPYKDPTATDLRGQCPGLNAAANHNFLPRNGRATIAQTVQGLGDAYNLSPELSAGLAVIAILISGDIPSGQWSIGGGFPSSLPLLLSNPGGIAGTHNKYEGDASIVRGDAYLNNGNVGVFQWHSWNNLWNLAGSEDNLDFPKIFSQSSYTAAYSENNNPYYFSGPFSGLVAPAAHHFVINFMSNHSAENPGGFLTKDTLQQFFAVTGTGAGASGDNPGDFVHNRGKERIPLNWYRRNSADKSSLADVALNLLAGAQAHPNTLRIGGNTGKVNTFTGANLADISGGVFNGANLLQGNNLICFGLQAARAGNIDQLNGLVGTIGGALKPLTDTFTSTLAGIGCPQLASYNPESMKQFPGFSGS